MIWDIIFSVYIGLVAFSVGVIFTGVLRIYIERFTRIKRDKRLGLGITN